MPPPAPSNPPFLIEATGDGQAPILDYAGPSSRGKFRLPAESILEIDSSPAQLTVTETLAGQAGAFAALIFAAFTLVTLASAVLAPISRGSWHRYATEITLFAGFAIVEIALMLAVIHNTWRKTVLIVTPAQTSLRFWSPLRGTLHHIWPADKLREARINIMTMPNRRAEFPELELDLWGEPRVRLFLGHRQAELGRIVREIERLQPPTLQP
jgi:hypothetical protein